MKDKSVSANEASLRALIKFGLSKQEAGTYLSLLQNGPLSVKELSEYVRVFPNALYRLLKELEEKGLIVSTGKHPNVFKALPPSISLEAFVKKQIAEVELNKETILSQLQQKGITDQTHIDVLGGKREFFRAYVEMAKNAKKQVDIISIGEEIPEEIILTNRDCLERGVTIRFIAHSHNKNNKDLLARWVKMGLLVRHYPDGGFHLVIMDNTRSLLSVNNPKNTDDRLAIKIFSEALSKSLGDYFNTIWERATPII